MQQLLAIAKIDDGKIRTILNIIATEELLRLSRPCYRSNLRHSILELLHACALTKQNIEKFAERTWKGRSEENSRVAKDPVSLFIVWLMWHYLNARDLKTFKSALIVYMIRQYSDLFKKYLYSCNEEIFLFTLENITKIHLFFKTGGISEAIQYLCDDLEEKHINDIKNWNLNNISAFIRDSRGRLNQSFRSFANGYYINAKVVKTSGASTEAKEEKITPQALGRTKMLTNNVARQICRNGYVDEYAIHDARKLKRIKGSTAISLVRELSNSNRSAQYFGDVKLILELFLRKAFYNRVPLDKYIRLATDLMSIKRTKQPVYLKQQVRQLLFKLVKNRGIENEIKNLSPQTQSSIAGFLAHYIARVLRNLLGRTGNKKAGA